MDRSFTVPRGRGWRSAVRVEAGRVVSHRGGAHTGKGHPAGVVGPMEPNIAIPGRGVGWVGGSAMNPSVHGNRLIGPVRTDVLRIDVGLCSDDRTNRVPAILGKHLESIAAARKPNDSRRQLMTFLLPWHVLPPPRHASGDDGDDNRGGEADFCLGRQLHALSMQRSLPLVPARSCELRGRDCWTGWSAANRVSAQGHRCRRPRCSRGSLRG